MSPLILQYLSITMSSELPGQHCKTYLFFYCIALTLYHMDLCAFVQKNWNLECDLYMNKATQKYFIFYFLELAFSCIQVLTIGIAMQNLVNYDSAGPVPIGIVMQNLVNCI